MPRKLKVPGCSHGDRRSGCRIPVPAIAQTAGSATWRNDLTPIGPADWNYDFAEHVLERAGHGGTLARHTLDNPAILRGEMEVGTTRGLCRPVSGTAPSGTSLSTIWTAF